MKSLEQWREQVQAQLGAAWKVESKADAGGWMLLIKPVANAIIAAAPDMDEALVSENAAQARAAIVAALSEVAS